MPENNDLLKSLNGFTQDETNETPAAATTLYLRLGESNLHIARFADGRNPYFDFCRYRLRPRTSLVANLREAMDGEQILKSPYHRVEVLTTGPTTLIPLADFQEEDCQIIYDYCFPTKQKHRVFYDVIPGANAVLLFALDEVTCQALESIFGSVRYTSVKTPVIRHFSTSCAGRAHRAAYVYCHEQTVDIAVFEDKRLIMANAYEVYNAADVAYFVMNVAHQTGLDAATDPIFIVETTGSLAKAAEEVRLFAAQTRILRPAEEFNRHIVATTQGVPYDMINMLIRK